MNIENTIDYEYIHWKINEKSLINMFYSFITVLSNNNTLLNTNISIPSDYINRNNDINTQRLSEIFRSLYKTYKNSKLHIFDDNGTLAIIELEKNLAWINPARLNPTTNFSFNCEISNLNSLARVNRKNPVILNDWIWNLFWNSPDVATTISPEDGHYKILYWPKPLDNNNKKIIFQLSACFIQGGKISTIAEQLNLPIETVRRFIGANITINNIQKINLWDPHYSPSANTKSTEDIGFVKSFFNSLRNKFHL